MVATFTPSIAPAPSTSLTDTPRRKVAKFSDGYSQRAADGLNYYNRTVTLSWDILTQAQFDEINGFFDARADGTPFDYTLPLEAVLMRWIWTTKQPGFVGGPTHSLRVSVERVFDLS